LPAVFGLGFGEIFLLLIVGLVVVGPRNLPTLMRTAGRWVSKVRRMTTDLRSQSGIDEIIRDEGLENDIRELRALSRGNVIDTLVQPSIGATAAAAARRKAADLPAASATAAISPEAAPARKAERLTAPHREREYPLIGCDSYGAMADDAPVYVPPTPRPKPTPAVEPAPTLVTPLPDAAPVPAPGEPAPAKDAPVAATVREPAS